MATVFKSPTQSGVRWCLDLRSHGKGREFFKTKTDAETALKNFEDERKQAGDVWVSLNYLERAEAIEVMQECGRLGVSLRSLLESYKRTPEAVSRKTRKEASAEFIDAKRKAERRDRYVETLEYYVNRLPDGPLHQITPAQISAVIHTAGKSSHSRSGVQTKLATFFAWCVRQGYRLDNPCDRLETISVKHAKKRILTPAELEMLLKSVSVKHPRALAFLVLGSIPGVRPDELGRLGWSHVNIDTGIVEIDDTVSKVPGQRRIVTLPANALEWLKLAKKKRAKLPFGRRVAARIFRAVLKFKTWPQDCLRHSAASYLMAKDRDAGKVAEMLGNSPGVLLRVYRELVTDGDAKKWFAIKPTAPKKNQGKPRLPKRRGDGRKDAVQIGKRERRDCPDVREGKRVIR